MCGKIFFYSRELKLGGNYLWVKIHITSEFFFLGHVCTLEMGAIYLYYEVLQKKTF